MLRKIYFLCPTNKSLQVQAILYTVQCVTEIDICYDWVRRKRTTVFKYGGHMYGGLYALTSTNIYICILRCLSLILCDLCTLYTCARYI
jgi:hypothetical protein